MKEASTVVGNQSPHDEAIAEVRERLQEDLSRVRKSLCSLVVPPNHRIQGPIMYAVENTGRLLRPTLVLLSSYLLEDGWQGATPPQVIDGAAAVEILHLATLCHDDVIDGAQVRRGRPSANAKYGEAVALLTGDYLLARCMQTAASLGMSRMTAMADTLIDVCVGQMLESSQLYNPFRTEEEYFAAISGKTARLLRTAAAMGALQSGASEDAQAALESFGHNLGMAFQIWDDILDICSRETGKQAAKDILNGVYTLPVIYAVKDFRDRLQSLLRLQQLSDEQCQEVISLVHESGGIGRAADVAQRYVSDALYAVESHPATAKHAPVVRQCLRDLVDTFASQHPALQALRDTAQPTPEGLHSAT
ncbi:polyprenyl synthetase family protein [Streptomyces sp. F001]|uniref:polyprenyl synthetase family protein n=1 Tax=Streptomyces sp. F001 TaxID=1510026 RepID=UPI00101E6B18|nr:polyprenyl synthetase family protein [Streptomyces sp. F001]RZB13981.1 polyprenyl synthetase family protein [Streptomyces sp. F001]